MALTRARISAAASASSRPLSTWRVSDFDSPATMASAESCLRLRSTTSMPALAATSAMPDPMIPEPMIPIRVMVMWRLPSVRASRPLQPEVTDR